MTEVKPIADCKTVAELLAAPERWCQLCDALTRKGVLTTPRNRSAARWDLCGALGRIYRDHDSYYEALTRLRHAIGTESVTVWQDDPGRTHAEVLDAAIRARI